MTMVTRSRSLRTLLAVVVTAAVAAPVASVSAAPQPGTPAPVGQFAAFRTMDTGKAPRASDTAACVEHFGAVQGAVVPIELDARLFSFSTSPETGTVVDETARDVGGGYLCIAAADPSGVPAEQAGGGDGYARVRLPRIGRVEADGYCALVTAPAQVGAAFVNCRLSVVPDERRGIVGGSVTSNSILNPAGVPGNPTGSIWTAYVERVPGYLAPQTPAPLVPGEVAGDVSGQRTTYVVARGEHTTYEAGDTCAGTQHPIVLRRAQPGGRTALLPRRVRGAVVGRMVSCTANVDPQGNLTTSVTVTGPSGDPVTLTGVGRCQDLGDPEHGVERICSFQVVPVPAAGIQGGLITTIAEYVAPVSEVGPGDDPLVTISMLPTPAA